MRRTTLSLMTTPLAALACIATLWLGHALGWTAIRWPVALIADLVVVGVTLRAMSPEHRDVAVVAMLLQWALLAAYVVGIAIRTLVLARKVTPFEVVQTVAVLLVGFGGALFLSRATGSVPVTIGVVSLAFGVACYGAVVLLFEGRGGLERNLHFYATLALALVLTGCMLVLRGPWPGAVFAVLGVLGIGSWSRVGRPYRFLHGAVYLLAAGVVSGSVSYGARALAANPVEPWDMPGLVVLVVVVAAALSAALAAARPGPERDVLASALRLIVAGFLLLAATGWLVGLLAPLAAGSSDRTVNLGALATLRTAVLVAAALLVAWIGRHARFREWAWLVYPLLVAVGLKMVVQDFRYSRPATLFIALAVYGTALIVAPRLRLAEARLQQSLRTPDEPKN